MSSLLFRRRSSAAPIHAKLLALVLTSLPLPATASVPRTLTYAGELREEGAPANGTFTVIFDLYDAPTAGTRLFSQMETSLAVTDGELTVELGDDVTNPLLDPVLEGGHLFLAMTVDGRVLSPRTPLTSAPYAIRAATAEDAESVGGLTAEDIAGLYTAGEGLTKAGTELALAHGGVARAHIADGAVTGAKLGLDAVTRIALANDAVSSPEIVDGAVATADLASASVTSAKLAVGAVTATKLAESTVRGVHLQAGIQVYVEPPACEAGRLTSKTTCRVAGVCIGQAPEGCQCAGGSFVCSTIPLGLLVRH